MSLTNPELIESLAKREEELVLRCFAAHPDADFVWVEVNYGPDGAELEQPGPPRPRLHATVSFFLDAKPGRGPMTAPKGARVYDRPKVRKEMISPRA